MEPSAGQDRPAVSPNPQAPRVSVVIPAYNAERCIGEAIQSVLKQSYREWEVVVVDDGSTDRTSEVVAGFGERVRYLRQTNAGAAAARNAGIREARGELIAFLDADDVWLPDKLQLQVAYLDAHPETALVYADVQMQREDGRLLPSYLAEKKHAGSGRIFDAVVQEYFIHTSSTLIRRSCLEEVGGFDPALKTAEDRDLWLRLAYRWPVGLVEQPLALVRRSPGSLSNLEFSSARRVQMFEKALRTFPELPERSRGLIRRQLALNHYDLGLGYLSRLDRREARRHLMKAAQERSLLVRALGLAAVTLLPPGVLRWLQRVKRGQG